MNDALDGSITRAPVSCAWRNVLRCPTRSARRIRLGSWRLNHAHVVELIPPLIEKMREGYDMVIVSRYLDTAKSVDDTWVTGFGNWLFTNIINLLHRGHLTDAMVMYRAYKKSVPSLLDLDKDEAYTTPESLFHTRISWEPLLSVRALKSLRYLLVSDLDTAARLRLDVTLGHELDRHLRAFLRYVIDRDIATARLMDELRDLKQPARVS